VNELSRPAWTLGRREAPAGLSAQRAWKWCLLRTVRDARLGRKRDRPIAAHHLERLFVRRWAQWDNAVPPKAWSKLNGLGKRLIGKRGYVKRVDQF